MSGNNRGTFWERFDVRAAAMVTLLSFLPIIGLLAIVWAAFMIWNRDFRRTFGDWFIRWVLAGLILAEFLGSPISEKLNLPPSWVAVIIVGLCSWIALRHNSRRPPYGWR